MWQHELWEAEVNTELTRRGRAALNEQRNGWAEFSQAVNRVTGGAKWAPST